MLLPGRALLLGDRFDSVFGSTFSVLRRLQEHLLRSNAAAAVVDQGDGRAVGGLVDGGHGVLAGREGGPCDCQCCFANDLLRQAKLRTAAAAVQIPGRGT